MTLNELKDKVNKQFDAICDIEESSTLIKWCYLTGVTDTSAIAEEGSNEFKEDLSEETIGYLSWLMPGGAGRPYKASSTEGVVEDTVEDTQAPEVQPQNEIGELSEIEPVIAQ